VGNGYDTEVAMKISIRAKRRILISLALLVAFLVANIHQVGQFVGGHYDWVCDNCRVGLYHCPFKKITYLKVPTTYEAHPHSWRLVHRPPMWLPWKPWQWLVCVGSDRKLLTEPDPRTVFQSAYPQEKYSDEAGVRKLASDPHYDRAREIQGKFDGTKPHSE
jgi:hypothetical protein